MSDENLKAIEQRAYLRGYQAGRKKKAADVQQDRAQAAKNAFRQRAFLAALPAFIQSHGWKTGNKEITSLVDRVALAWDAADEALKRYY